MLRYGATALVVLIFLLSIHCAEERTERLLEHLESTKKPNEVQCRMLRAVARRPRIAMSWLTGCATEGFEQGSVTACPLVVEFSRGFLAQAAEELAFVPDGQ